MTEALTLPAGSAGEALVLARRELRVAVPGDPAAGATTIQLAGVPAEVALFFLEWLAVEIASPLTRLAYARAIGRWLEWCVAGDVDPLSAQPLHAAAWREQQTFAARTLRQRVAALRGFYNAAWSRGLVDGNPFLALALPRPDVPFHRGGMTPALSREELRQLIPWPARPRTLVEARDQAVMATLFYAIARSGSVAALRVGDYTSRRGRKWLRFHGKRAVVRNVPCSRRLERYLDLYIERAAIGDDRPGPLFRPAETPGNQQHRLQRKPMTRLHIAQMVRRRLAAIGAEGSPQSFRVSWITMFAAAGGHLETARDAAGHAALETTSGYLRSAREIPPEEMDRIVL